MKHPINQPLELWGGIECTRNRVGDSFIDQIDLSGHRKRIQDLDLIADLGVKTLRYPALWEWTVEDPNRWGWIKQRMTRLRRLGIRPICGFVHHGSGPRSVSLLDSDFVTGLERYAADYAQRFPWVTAYTPVNEPLTTARFSTLYGHWYPHVRNDRAFATAMINQCKATCLAMRAVRRINPAAMLVQTEDLGKTFSSPTLKYQADFENARRWLTFDLLCGRVDRSHPIVEYFQWIGVPYEKFQWFADHPSPPDILGINYYLTSERYLDRRISRYPAECRGGNGHHAYADVEAVRVRKAGLHGVKALLTEAWQRFRLPLAITEAHLGCTREEQMRWLFDVWREAQTARTKGVPVAAVTSWALLGAYDWDSLVTRSNGHYEAGAFDIQQGSPRRTAIAELVSELSNDRPPSHPVVNDAGWWKRNIRLIRCSLGGEFQPEPKGPPLLIVYDGDTLGRSILELCHQRGLAFKKVRRSALDLMDGRSIDRLFQRTRPWAVVHTTPSEETELPYRDERHRFRLHVDEPQSLAKACRRARLPLVTFSSSFVFDGTKGKPYQESDLPNPICEIGRIKAEAEERVLSALPSVIMIRPGIYFDVQSKRGFLNRMVRSVSRDAEWNVDSGTISISYVPEIVNTALDLLIDQAYGIWHLAGAGSVTWMELSKTFLKDYVVESDHSIWRLLRRNPNETVTTYRALTSEKGIRLPPWQAAVGRYAADAQAIRSI